MDILEISYKSTKYYFIKTIKGLLAFDTGWPDTYRKYKELLKEKGYNIKDIKWVIVSHFHIDHAGLAGMFLEKGIEFIVFKNQIEEIKIMEKLIKRKKMQYQDIDINKIKLMEICESRDWLNSIGIKGEVLITDCHSKDSISLILDNGVVFTGDLPPESFIMETDKKCMKNWKILKEKGAKNIKPAHGKEYYI
jgi:glyoxylase-like metal-dependent hydrolase (beta-lactamase superfamily II)